MSGAQISPEHLRRLTNRRGSQEAKQPAVEAQRIVEPTAAQVRAERAVELRRSRQQKQKRPHVLLVGLDGGWVKSLEQKKGMEGKVGVVASEIEPVGKRGRPRLRGRRYVATFGNSTQVGKLTSAAACALGAHQAPRQVGLGDGADGIKTETQRHFPDAVKIRDWSHLWRVIQKAIRARRPGQGAIQRTWRKQQYEMLLPLLWQGDVQAALTHLQTLRPRAEHEPIEALEDAITYLENQRDWIGNYQQWQEAGYPVGSGLGERESPW